MQLFYTESTTTGIYSLLQCVPNMYVVRSKHASLRKVFIKEINTLVLFPCIKRKMTSMIEGTVKGKAQRANTL